MSRRENQQTAEELEALIAAQLPTMPGGEARGRHGKKDKHVKTSGVRSIARQRGRRVGRLTREDSGT